MELDDIFGGGATPSTNKKKATSTSKVSVPSSVDKGILRARRAAISEEDIKNMRLSTIRNLAESPFDWAVRNVKTPILGDVLRAAAQPADAIVKPISDSIINILYNKKYNKNYSVGDELSTAGAGAVNATSDYLFTPASAGIEALKGTFELPAALLYMRDSKTKNPQDSVGFIQALNTVKQPAENLHHAASRLIGGLEYGTVASLGDLAQGRTPSIESFANPPEDISQTTVGGVTLNPEENFLGAIINQGMKLGKDPFFVGGGGIHLKTGLSKAKLQKAIDTQIGSTKNIKTPNQSIDTLKKDAAMWSRINSITGAMFNPLAALELAKKAAATGKQVVERLPEGNPARNILLAPIGGSKKVQGPKETLSSIATARTTPNEDIASALTAPPKPTKEAIDFETAATDMATRGRLDSLDSLKEKLVTEDLTKHANDPSKLSETVAKINKINDIRKSLEEQFPKEELLEDEMARRRKEYWVSKRRDTAAKLTVEENSEATYVGKADNPRSEISKKVSSMMGEKLGSERVIPPLGMGSKPIGEVVEAIIEKSKSIASGMKQMFKGAVVAAKDSARGTPPVAVDYKSGKDRVDAMTTEIASLMKELDRREQVGVGIPPGFDIGQAKQQINETLNKNLTMAPDAMYDVALPVIRNYEKYYSGEKLSEPPKRHKEQVKEVVDKIFRNPARPITSGYMAEAMAKRNESITPSRDSAIEAIEANRQDAMRRIEREISKYKRALAKATSTYNKTTNPAKHTDLEKIIAGTADTINRLLYTRKYIEQARIPESHIDRVIDSAKTNNEATQRRQAEKEARAQERETAELEKAGIRIKKSAPLTASILNDPRLKDNLSLDKESGTYKASIDAEGNYIPSSDIASKHIEILGAGTSNPHVVLTIDGVTYSPTALIKSKVAKKGFSYSNVLEEIGKRTTDQTGRAKEITNVANLNKFFTNEMGTKGNEVVAYLYEVYDVVKDLETSAIKDSLKKVFKIDQQTGEVTGVNNNPSDVVDAIYTISKEIAASSYNTTKERFGTYFDPVPSDYNTDVMSIFSNIREESLADRAKRVFTGKAMAQLALKINDMESAISRSLPKDTTALDVVNERLSDETTYPVGSLERKYLEILRDKLNHPSSVIKGALDVVAKRKGTNRSILSSSVLQSGRLAKGFKSATEITSVPVMSPGLRDRLITNIANMVTKGDAEGLATVITMATGGQAPDISALEVSSELARGSGEGAGIPFSVFTKGDSVIIQGSRAKSGFTNEVYNTFKLDSPVGKAVVTALTKFEGVDKFNQVTYGPKLEALGKATDLTGVMSKYIDAVLGDGATSTYKINYDQFRKTRYTEEVLTNGKEAADLAIGDTTAGANYKGTYGGGDLVKEAMQANGSFTNDSDIYNAMGLPKDPSGLPYGSWMTIMRKTTGSGSVIPSANLKAMGMALTTIGLATVMPALAADGMSFGHGWDLPAVSGWIAGLSGLGLTGLAIHRAYKNKLNEFSNIEAGLTTKSLRGFLGKVTHGFLGLNTLISPATMGDLLHFNAVAMEHGLTKKGDTLGATLANTAVRVISPFREHIKRLKFGQDIKIRVADNIDRQVGSVIKPLSKEEIEYLSTKGRDLHIALGSKYNFKLEQTAEAVRDIDQVATELGMINDPMYPVAKQAIIDFDNIGFNEHNKALDAYGDERSKLPQPTKEYHMYREPCGNMGRVVMANAGTARIGPTRNRKGDLVNLNGNQVRLAALLCIAARDKTGTVDNFIPAGDPTSVANAKQNARDLGITDPNGDIDITKTLMRENIKQLWGEEIKKAAKKAAENYIRQNRITDPAVKKAILENHMAQADADITNISSQKLSDMLNTKPEFNIPDQTTNITPIDALTIKRLESRILTESKNIWKAANRKQTKNTAGAVTDKLKTQLKQTNNTIDRIALLRGITRAQASQLVQDRFNNSPLDSIFTPPPNRTSIPKQYEVRPEDAMSDSFFPRKDKVLMFSYQPTLLGSLAKMAKDCANTAGNLHTVRSYDFTSNTMKDIYTEADRTTGHKAGVVHKYLGGPQLDNYMREQTRVALGFESKYDPKVAIALHAAKGAIGYVKVTSDPTQLIVQPTSAAKVIGRLPLSAAKTVGALTAATPSIIKAAIDSVTQNDPNTVSSFPFKGNLDVGDIQTIGRVLALGHDARIVDEWADHTELSLNKGVLNEGHKNILTKTTDLGSSLFRVWDTIPRYFTLFTLGMSEKGNAILKKASEQSKALITNGFNLKDAMDYKELIQTSNEVAMLNGAYNNPSRPPFFHNPIVHSVVGFLNYYGLNAISKDIAMMNIVALPLFHTMSLGRLVKNPKSEFTSYVDTIKDMQKGGFHGVMEPLGALLGDIALTGVKATTAFALAAGITSLGALAMLIMSKYQLDRAEPGSDEEKKLQKDYANALVLSKTNAALEPKMREWLAQNFGRPMADEIMFGQISNTFNADISTNTALRILDTGPMAEVLKSWSDYWDSTNNTFGSSDEFPAEDFLTMIKRTFSLAFIDKLGRGKKRRLQYLIQESNNRPLSHNEVEQLDKIVKSGATLSDSTLSSGLPSVPIEKGSVLNNYLGRPTINEAKATSDLNYSKLRQGAAGMAEKTAKLKSSRLMNAVNIAGTAEDKLKVAKIQAGQGVPLEATLIRAEANIAPGGLELLTASKKTPKALEIDLSDPISIKTHNRAAMTLYKHIISTKNPRSNPSLSAKILDDYIIKVAQAGKADTLPTELTTIPFIKRQLDGISRGKARVEESPDRILDALKRGIEGIERNKTRFSERLIDKK